MATKPSFHEYVMKDVFAEVAGVTSRAMFGGYGIYRDGLFFFALIADDRLYFKVDDSNRSDYESRGSRPFVYRAPGGKKMTMSYWELPETIAEDNRAVRLWVERAVAVAKRSKKR